MATKKKSAPPNPLESLSLDYRQLLGLLLWQRRIESPELAAVITSKDRDGLRDCLAYLKKGAEVRTLVRGDTIRVMLVDQGSKATVRRITTRMNAKNEQVTAPQDFEVEFVDGRPVMQPGDEIVGVGDVIKPIENNEQDYDRAQVAEQVRRARENAMSLANLLKTNAAAGTFSASMVNEAADALVLLASAR